VTDLKRSGIVARYVTRVNVEVVNGTPHLENTASVFRILFETFDDHVELVGSEHLSPTIPVGSVKSGSVVAELGEVLDVTKKRIKISSTCQHPHGFV
jgi:hypothetical protein